MTAAVHIHNSFGNECTLELSFTDNGFTEHRVRDIHELVSSMAVVHQDEVLRSAGTYWQQQYSEPGSAGRGEAGLGLRPDQWGAVAVLPSHLRRWARGQTALLQSRRSATEKSECYGDTEFALREFNNNRWAPPGTFDELKCQTMRMHEFVIQFNSIWNAISVNSNNCML